MNSGGWIAQIENSYFATGKKLVLIAAILVNWKQIFQVKMQLEINSPNREVKRDELRKLAKLCRACGLELMEDTKELNNVPFHLFPMNLRIAKGLHPIPLLAWECGPLHS